MHSAVDMKRGGYRLISCAVVVSSCKVGLSSKHEIDHASKIWSIELTSAQTDTVDRDKKAGVCGGGMLILSKPLG